jgi:riboflavin synthase
MFTGIVEETGLVLSFEAGEKAWRLVVEADEVAKDVKLGDSVAVNGCCLTVVAIDGKRIAFDLLEESVRLTSIQEVGPGGKVNLERALLPSTRMGGHFVSGHVDGMGIIEAIEPRGQDRFFRIKPDAESLKYIVHKGSITVDGISLTVAEVDEEGFAIWLIPHTMEMTNLHTKQAGDHVNLEYDLIAKYVEKLFADRG